MPIWQPPRELACQTRFSRWSIWRQQCSLLPWQYWQLTAKKWLAGEEMERGHLKLQINFHLPPTCQYFDALIYMVHPDWGILSFWKTLVQLPEFKVYDLGGLTINTLQKPNLDPCFLLPGHEGRMKHRPLEMCFRCHKTGSKLSVCLDGLLFYFFLLSEMESIGSQAGSVWG